MQQSQKAFITIKSGMIICKNLMYGISQIIHMQILSRAILQ